MKLIRLYYLFLLLVIICWSSLVSASPKTIIAEATYIMGDGETPAFAESMVLQKAKRYAIEEAGTYIESYSKIENFKLTRDEVQVLAGGVLKVEILEKKRTLIGDVVQFYIKIKTIVLTDNLEKLAKNIKSKNIGVEYKQLQKEFEDLFKELTEIKNQLQNAKSESDRVKALERIKFYERQFNSIKDYEKNIYSRLITTDSVLNIIDKKESQRKVAFDLIAKIANGIRIDIGNPDIILKPDKNDIIKNFSSFKKIKKKKYPTEQEIADMVMISIPLTINHSDTVWEDIDSTIMKIGGAKKDVFLTGRSSGQKLILVGLKGIVFQIGEDYETIMAFQEGIGSLSIIVEFFSEKGLIDSCRIEPSYSDSFNGYPVNRVSTLGQYGREVYNSALNKKSDECNLYKCNFGTEEYVLISNRPVIINAKHYMRLEDVKSLQKINAIIKQLEPQDVQKNDKKGMAEMQKCKW